MATVRPLGAVAEHGEAEPVPILITMDLDGASKSDEERVGEKPVDVNLSGLDVGHVTDGLRGGSTRGRGAAAIALSTASDSPGYNTPSKLSQIDSPGYNTPSKLSQMFFSPLKSLCSAEGSIQGPPGTPSSVSQLGSLQSSVRSIQSRATLTSTMSASSPSFMKFRAVLNISLSFLGTGMLGLPKGAADFLTAADAHLAVAVGLCTVMAVILACGFHMLGLVCESTKAKTYAEAWSFTVKRGDLAMLLVLIIYGYTKALRSFMVIADSITSLAAPLSPLLPAGAQWMVGRAGVLVVVCIVEYPIVVQKNFRRLVNASVLSTLCFSAILVVLAARYLDGSYAPGGRYGDFQQQAVEQAQAAGDDGSPLIQLMVLVTLLTNALSGHGLAPAVCRELPADRTSATIAGAVSGGFAGGGAVSAGNMVFGYLLFGEASKGNVLLNFDPEDPLGVAAKASVTLALLLALPLKFKPLRDDVFALIGLQQDRGALWAVSALQLAALATPVVFLTDLGMVQAAGGATIALCVSCIGPGVMYFFAASTRTGKALACAFVGWGSTGLVAGCIAVVQKFC